MSKDSDRAFDASIPGISTINADKIVMSTLRGEQRARCNADSRGSSAFEQLHRVDLLGKFAPQNESALRPRQANALRKCLDHCLAHLRDLVTICLPQRSEIPVVPPVAQKFGDGQRRQTGTCK